MPPLDLLLKDLGHLLQAHIPLQMAIVVVVAFEMVDINHQHRQRLAVTHGMFPCLIQCLIQGAAVGQPG